LDGPASGERIIAHLAFAKAVAARSLDPRCRGADREDLIAWGVVGLVHAGGKLPPLSQITYRWRRKGALPTEAHRTLPSARPKPAKLAHGFRSAVGPAPAADSGTGSAP
jgi:hypothetical protein